jgi:hypothetical protein
LLTEVRVLDDSKSALFQKHEFRARAFPDRRLARAFKSLGYTPGSLKHEL